MPPPSVAGADQFSVMLPLPTTAVTDWGWPGTVYGVADAGELTAPVPLALIAATRNVYAVEFVRPVAVYDVDVELLLTTIVVHVAPPSALRSIM